MGRRHFALVMIIALLSSGGLARAADYPGGKSRDDRAGRDERGGRAERAGREGRAEREEQGAKRAPAGDERIAGISLDEAIDRAQRRYKARVIRADVRQDGDRTTYILRMLSDDSRVWTVKVDAATGAMN